MADGKSCRPGKRQHVSVSPHLAPFSRHLYIFWWAEKTTTMCDRLCFPFYLRFIKIAAFFHLTFDCNNSNFTVCMESVRYFRMSNSPYMSHTGTNGGWSCGYKEEAVPGVRLRKSEVVHSDESADKDDEQTLALHGNPRFFYKDISFWFILTYIGPMG
jgi:hypothetical protein